MKITEQNKLILNRCINGVDKKYLYRDYEYDKNGIRYKPFFKLYIQSRNDISSYTLDGWQILWFLMSRAVNNTYIKISKTTIIKELHKSKISKYRINNAFKNLQESGIIQSNTNLEKTQLDTMMDILICYNDTYSGNNLYKAIPIDFIYKIVIDMTYKQFALYTVLFTYYRWYEVTENVNKETGEVYNKLEEYKYAFPKQTDICKLLKIEPKRIKPLAESLENLGYLKLEYNNIKSSQVHPDTNRNVIKNMHYQYDITLLSREEYIKNHLLEVEYDSEKYKNYDKIVKEYKKKYRDKWFDKMIEERKDIINVYYKLWAEETQSALIKEQYAKYKI